LLFVTYASHYTQVPPFRSNHLSDPPSLPRAFKLV
jgi:hypothetical protein